MTESPEKKAKKSEMPAATANSNLPPRSGRGRVAWVIVFLVVFAAIGAAGSAYLYQLLNVTKEQADESGAAFTATRSDLSALQKSLNDLRDLLPEIVKEQQAADAQLQKTVDVLNDGLRQMNTTVIALQEKLAAMGGTAETAQRNWVQAEVVYLLRIANQRLDLAGDRDGAVVALQTADQRLYDLGVPAFTPVRTKIADEIQSLNIVVIADIPGASLRLADFATAVAQLPLKGPARVRTEKEGEEIGEGWSFGRAVDRVKRAFSGLVKISQNDEEIIPVLAPEEKFFLRRNLELQIEMARLSAIRRDQATYSRSLDSAAQWLNRYFDSEDAEVERIRSGIKELATLILSPDLPDINSSLILMQSVISGPGERL